MIITKSINHLKLFKPYSFNRLLTTNKDRVLTTNKDRVLTTHKKRSYIIANDITNEYCYKKQKLNNRCQLSSSYIDKSILENNIQWKYDIGIIKNKLNEKLENKSDGYKRDGLLFEKTLGIIYENEGYNVKHIGGTNDAGVDLIVEKENKIIAIQAKNYNDNMTNKFLNKNNIKSIFGKIKTLGESKHLEKGLSFHSARLHIYNDNIVSYKPLFLEQIAIKYKFDMTDKLIYGKTWILNYTNCLTQESIQKFYDLFDE